MINEKKERIEQDISFWLDREKALKELFKGDIVNEKHFLSEKLRYFNSVQNKYQGNLSEGEKIVLNVLKGETRKLEHQLYPNPIVRLLVKGERAIKKFLESRNALKEQTRMKQPPLTFNQKKLDNNLRVIDNGTKQNLKADVAQEIKQQEQVQKQNGEPLKNSAPERNISMGPVRNTKVVGESKESAKLKDDPILKKQLRHRLH